MVPIGPVIGGPMAAEGIVDPFVIRCQRCDLIQGLAGGFPHLFDVSFRCCPCGSPQSGLFLAPVEAPELVGHLAFPVFCPILGQVAGLGGIPQGCGRKTPFSLYEVHPVSLHHQHIVRALVQKSLRDVFLASMAYLVTVQPSMARSSKISGIAVI